MKYLLDSVILIDHLNAIHAATVWLTRHHQESCISVITRAEVLAGVSEVHLHTTKELLHHFTTLPITSEDADLAAQLRQKQHWKFPDAFQAVLATRHGLLLATRNTKDFSKKQYNFVSIPYQV